MKNIKLFALLIAPLVVSGCNNDQYVPPEMTDKNISFKIATHFGSTDEESEINESCAYSDYWLLKESYEFNYDLALASIMAAGASYSTPLDDNGEKISNFLNEVGYKNIKLNQYYSEGIKLEDSIGVIAASKRIIDSEGKESTVLAIFPRNAGYGAEWMGDFNIGVSGAHEGFVLARDEMLRFMKQYIISSGIRGDIKVWSSGYSRGAATVNLFGGFLAEDNGYFDGLVTINPKDIYIYTIGTPNAVIDHTPKSEILSVSASRGEGYYDTEMEAYTYSKSEGNIDLSSSIYKGIHNFIAVGDFMTKLPFADWSFTRYGQTEVVNYGDSEMLTYLTQYSPETALTFSDKNYSTEFPYKTFDFVNLEAIDLEEKITPDALISERLHALLKIDSTREGIIEKHFNRVLGSITSIYGLEPDIASKIGSDLSPLIKIALFSYLEYVGQRLNASDSIATANVLMDLITLMGKEISDKETYTDQQFLSDLFDYLINDYQTSEVAVKRAQKVASLLPGSFATSFINLLEFAKSKNIQVKVVDDLLYLLTYFMVENPTDLLTITLSYLLSSQIPVTYVPLISAFITHIDYSGIEESQRAAVAVKDVIDCCVNGSKDGQISDKVARGIVISLATSTLSSKTNIVNLIRNGSYEYEDKKVVNDPVSLSTLMEEVVSLLTEDKGITKAADEAMVSYLVSIKGENSAKYFDYLIEHPAEIRLLLMTFLFNPTGEYSLANDIKNAYTLINTITFLSPAHNHEMYLSYLKTKITVKPNA